VGGGRVRIRRINTIEVDFTGEYSTIIIGHQDKKGVISFITTFMAEQNINIASLRLYREAKGKDAFAIIETDDYITQELEEMYRRHQYINSVDLIEI
jgi:L-serine dehydratase